MPCTSSSRLFPRTSTCVTSSTSRPRCARRSSRWRPRAPIGATLVGVMILIFLRDVRTVVVVLFNIPLALTASLVGLWLTGNTLNIMSLGGLALAIGILVDEAVVTVENTHSQMRETHSLARAARRAFTATAAARFLAMACVLAVFIPTFIMKEPVRSLFMPLTLAVGFSMIASYVLSSTLVPVLTVWLMKHRETSSEKATLFDRILPPFGRVVEKIAELRWVAVPAYMAACGLILWFLGRQVGTELFPRVDVGQFVLRFRAPPGSEYGLTFRTAVKILDVIDKETRGNVAISMGYVGLAATNTATNNMLLFMRGPDDGELRVRLVEDGEVALADLRERLRKAIPEEIVPWLKGALEKYGVQPARGRQAVEAILAGLRAGGHRQRGDEPGVADACGSGRGGPESGSGAESSPENSGRNEEDPHAPRCAALPTARLSGGAGGHRPPACRIERHDGERPDRRASGRYILQPVRDQKLLDRPEQRSRLPSTGRGAGAQMDRPEQIETLPLKKVDPVSNLLVRDIAKVQTGTVPGEVDRTSMQRYLSVIANVEGEDLGRASQRIEQAVAAAGVPPRGVRVQIRGQIAPMEEMFKTLAVGMALAVAVILVMLTGYFQSFRMGLVSIGAVPGVVCGVVMILLVSDTTLNIESFMGSVMCIGVSVANSVMLTTFMGDYWQSGMTPLQAAVKGAKDRLRPVLMTAIAMILGTVPMALALEKGSEMTAPLGRAVIGGLVVSTFATMLVVPAFFVLLMSSAKNVSPSIDPDDPSSAQYDGQTQDHPGQHGDHAQGEPSPRSD